MKRHSVSLIPYVPNKGFIVCEEFRTNTNDRETKSVQSHFIGGKIEDGEDVIVAACREFYEEVGSGFTTPELIEAVTESVHCSCEIVTSEKKSLAHVFVITNTATMTGPVRDKFENVVESFEPIGDVHKLKY
jgi:8-oxo-dGTP pyrophosphatase MutT (NUDIX family)